MYRTVKCCCNRRSQKHQQELKKESWDKQLTIEELRNKRATWHFVLAQTANLCNTRKQEGVSPNKITVGAGDTCKGQYITTYGAGDALKGTEVQGYVLNLSPKKVNQNAPTGFQEDRILLLRSRSTVKRAFLRVSWFCQEMPNNERGGEQDMMMLQ